MHNSTGEIKGPLELAMVKDLDLDYKYRANRPMIGDPEVRLFITKLFYALTEPYNAIAPA